MFVQIVSERLEAALPRPGGRRTGRHLDNRGVAMELLGRASWQTGVQEPFGIVAFCRRAGLDEAPAGTSRLTWRRGRRALAELESRHLASAELHPFHLGRVTLCRQAMVHDKDRPEERFVQLVPSALAGIATEHALSWEATLGGALATILWTLLAGYVPGVNDHLSHAGITAITGATATLFTFVLGYVVPDPMRTASA